MIKTVFRAFWALWGGWWFAFVVVPSSLVFGLLLLIFGERISDSLLRICIHVYAPFLLKVYGIRLDIRGREEIDFKRSYIVVSNHESNLDILSNTTATPYPFTFYFLAKKELTKVPFFGLLVRYFNVVVDRSSAASRKESMKKMIASLEKGKSILIYPEGTRNRTGEPLARFYDGAFRLAIASKYPILVQTLKGAKELRKPNKLLDLSPGTIEVYFDKPIEVQENDTIESLKQKVIDTMMQHLS